VNALTDLWHLTRRGALALIAVALAAGPLVALAHDTWFERIDAAAGQPLQLALGTGTHFPRYEDPVQAKYVEHLTCTDAKGAAHKPEPAREGRRHTVLRVPGLDAAAFGCVMRLQPFEIELTPALVDVYFDEIRAGEALRAVVARQRALGRPFQERYLKVARIEGVVAPPRAESQPLDVQRVAPGGELKAGAEVVFEVQRDGKPLPDLPVQLLNDAAPAGLWTRTDAAGRVKLRLPLPGRWLLRGVDLRPPAGEGARWESRFIAYTFEVAR
jgi:hypothetical protein